MNAVAAAAAFVRVYARCVSGVVVVVVVVVGTVTVWRRGGARAPAESIMRWRSGCMRRRYADSVLTSLGLRKAHGPTTTRTGRPIRPDSRLRDVYKRRERRTGWGEGAVVVSVLWWDGWKRENWVSSTDACYRACTR